MIAAEFIDPKIQKEYQENGFVCLKGFLNRQQIEHLLHLFELNYPHEKPSSTLWNSLCDIPHDKSSVLSNAILNVVRPVLEKHMKNFVCPAATFLVKNPVEEGTVTLHRDFSVQDEENFAYQNIWLPLVDTTPQNGQLCVLKHSHNFFNYPLPHNTVWPYLKHESLLLEYSDFIYAKAGDLIVYSDRALHASLPNKTNEPRPVVHFGLLHPEAKLYYYYLDENKNEVTVYEVPYPFFFENAWGNQDERFPVFKKFKYEPSVYSKEDINLWLEMNFTARIPA